jgi:UDP-glucose 4-epimerase
MTKALVTGGAGFIGSHLVDALLDQGYEVVVLDDLSSGVKENLDAAWNKHGARLMLVIGSICDVATVAAAMKGVQHVFHQAAKSLVPLSLDHPEMVTTVNVMGTLTVLQEAREAGVERVVYASSASVYGDAIQEENGIPVGAVHEGRLPAPISPYAASKLSAEYLCHTWTSCYGLATTSLRYFNVYGPRQRIIASNYGLVIPKFLDMLRRGESPTIFGDGFQTRDFTHVSDVVAANLAALEAPPGSFYNVGSGVRTDVCEVAGRLNQALGTSIEPTFLPEREGDIRHTCAAIDHARIDMGWEPRVSFEEGLKTLVGG